ncbi:hypothetical protein SAMN04488243_1244 [Thermus arciformis]|uniref:PH domain-containing protein n=1 Tax=Thermus arciformis TaxID=482827 RepID=A0A1G7I5J6_9DEIN|nr:hypothetical protein [Thermus arciformis]SDF07962.1 hypothetical protein SAMN04488243_1244 [Thermus arciformis]
MRLTPKRDGSPRGLLLFLYLTSLVALLAVAATAEASERPLLLALVAADGLLMGVLFLWLVGFPERLFYEIQGPFLVIHHPLGKRQVHRSEVAAAVATAYALPLLAFGPKAEMPGYYRVRFRLRTVAFPQGLPVEAFVGARRGEGVLLVLKDGTGLLLNPEDPKPLLAWKEAK